MKISLPNFNQKTKVHSWFILGIITITCSVFFSCSKEHDSESITESDAVDIVTGTLAPNSYGLVESISNASETAGDSGVYSSTPNLNCGQKYSHSIDLSDSQSTYSYNYSIQQNYEMNCTALGIPESFTFNQEINGSYDAVRMSSKDSSTASFVITGLNLSNPTVNLNGSYQRSGTQVSKMRNKNTIESNVQYNLTNLTVNKTTYNIENGTSALSIQLKSNGETKTYSGSITFLGNGSANLVINGNSYAINW